MADEFTQSNVLQDQEARALRNGINLHHRINRGRLRSAILFRKRRGDRDAVVEEQSGACSVKRGPAPTKGFDFAIPVARRRGRVMRFQSSPWYVADFTIHGNGILSLVRLRLARRLYATIAEITSDFSDTIAELGTVPGGDRSPGNSGSIPDTAPCGSSVWKKPGSSRLTCTGSRS